MYMHCSLCGYKSKCPMAMERHRISRHSSMTSSNQMTVFVSENHRVPCIAVGGVGGVGPSSSVTSSWTNTTAMQTTSDYDSFRTSTVPSVTTDETPPIDCEMENNETCENRQIQLDDDVIKHFSTGKRTDHRLEGTLNSCWILSPLWWHIQENTAGSSIWWQILSYRRLNYGSSFF